MVSWPGVPAPGFFLCGLFCFVFDDEHGAVRSTSKELQFHQVLSTGQGLPSVPIAHSVRSAVQFVAYLFEVGESVLLAELVDNRGV